MTTTVERLRTTLAGLSLTAIDARLETLLENASKKEPSYGDFLLEVMSAEADARKQRYLNTRLQLAHLPLGRLIWRWPWRKRRFSLDRPPTS
jgi:hypothetical protein